MQHFHGLCLQGLVKGEVMTVQRFWDKVQPWLRMDFISCYARYFHGDPLRGLRPRITCVNPDHLEVKGEVNRKIGQSRFATFLPVAIELIQNVFPTPVTYTRNLGSSYDPATGEVTQNTEQFNISAGVISESASRRGRSRRNLQLDLMDRPQRHWRAAFADHFGFSRLRRDDVEGGHDRSHVQLKELDCQQISREG